MAQWEYRKLLVYSISAEEAEETLKLEGEAGWELVSVFPTKATEFWVTMYFKRPKEDVLVSTMLED